MLRDPAGPERYYRDGRRRPLRFFCFRHPRSGMGWDRTTRSILAFAALRQRFDIRSYPSLPVQDSATRTAPGALAGGRAGALFIRRRGFSPVPTSVILFLVKSLPPPLFAAALCVLASRLRSRRLIGLPPLIKSAYLCGPSGSQSKIIVSIIGP